MDIIDFDQAWRDQDDLDALCAEMDDFKTVECCVDNAEYGFADVLKAYSGYPFDKPVQAVIPHGVYLDSTRMVGSEARAPVPAVLNYPAFRAAVWEQHSDKAVIPAACPFVYALELFRERFEPVAEPRGTIFYPAHTVRGTNTNARWEEVAAELLAFEERFQPITVCMHIRDYNLGLHRPFERAGMRIVSAGNCGDSQFIFRWLHLLSAHAYAASNDAGGPALYATRFGVPVLLLDHLVDHVFNDPVLLVLQSMKLEREEAKRAKELRQRIADVFRDDAGRREKQLVETVDYLLGVENLKTPDELKADLEHAASLVD